MNTTTQLSAKWPRLVAAGKIQFAQNSQNLAALELRLRHEKYYAKRREKAANKPTLFQTQFRW